MAEQPFDQLSGDIWYDGTLRALVGSEAARAEPWTCTTAAACSKANAHMVDGSSNPKSIPSVCWHLAAMLGFEIPWSADQINSAKEETLARMNLADAYIRPVAWRGSEMMGISAQKNTIHLAIAAWEWPSYFKPEERLKGIRLDLADYRRPDPKTAPVQGQGCRALHDLHHFQARRRSQGLHRCPDARLARPCRRGDRRQRVLHQGRHDPHADAGLLPGRHHPPYGDRPCPGPGHRSGGTHDPAGGTGRLRTVLRHRHGRGSHPGVRDRRQQLEVGDIIKTLMQDYDAAVRPQVGEMKTAATG
jgi:branched-chain amino acid aminotransferase